MTPQYKMDSVEALMNTPISGASSHTPQVLGSLATLKPVVRPVVVSHYDISPVVDVYASVQGRDLGGVSADVSRIVAGFQSHLTRGSSLQFEGR